MAVVSVRCNTAPFRARKLVTIHWGKWDVDGNLRTPREQISLRLSVLLFRGETYTLKRHWISCVWERDWYPETIRLRKTETNWRLRPRNGYAYRPHLNGAFRRRSSNRKNLKTPAFRVRVDGKHYGNGTFRKWWHHDSHVIFMTEISSNTNSKWSVIVAFSYSCWRKTFDAISEWNVRFQISPAWRGRGRDLSHWEMAWNIAEMLFFLSGLLMI